jgi:nicotinamidase-related amidase
MDGLTPEPSDYVVVKKGHSAFSDTHLDRLLTNLGVDRYVLAGGGVDDSIGETIRTGGRLGYEQYVVEDALYPPGASGLEKIQSQVDVLTVDNVASAMSLDVAEEPGGPGYAMVLVDMQNDFMKPSQPNRSTIIENTQDVAKAVRARGWPVVYVYVLRREDNLDDAHPPQQTRQRVIARSLGPGVTHCAIGTWGAQIVDELQPQAGDFLVDKQGGSGFGFTPLHRILRNLNVHRLLMTGGSASGCVRATALDGVALGYDVTVIGDATYGGGPSALEFLTKWCTVRQTADVLPELTTARAKR